MSTFYSFKIAVQKQFDKMKQYSLFVTNVEKDKMWETYLKSFPKGSNPIYKERTEHDCQCCKQFIRTCGNMVAIKDNKLMTIWDVTVDDEHYQVVANAMAKLVKSKAVANAFLHYEAKAGTNFNHQDLGDGKVKKWEHFYLELPSSIVKRKDDIGSLLSNIKSSKDVFKRGLKEITVEAIETVLELISQNSIYRGREKKRLVEEFFSCKKEYDKLEKSEKDNYCWANAKNAAIARIRNDVIGTLLVDLSNGEDLEKAVRAFEIKVAPTNYQRPTALITKSMVEAAQKKVKELGIDDSLHRRFAVVEDVTINNVLFADRSIKKQMDVFDELVKETPVKSKKLDKTEEIGIEDFINNVLPKVDTIEAMLENKHINNLMSLIAPQHKDARQIFKWNNNFSWNYNGEVTDSIKERVKKAGGNVNGVLRCSLSWFNYDDLDIHVIEPNGHEIFFGNKNNRYTTGELDVDMNAYGHRSRNAVENITWTNKQQMLSGVYKVFIHNYSKRETIDVGFDAEIEYNGVIYSFHYGKALKQGERVDVAHFRFLGNELEFIKSLPSTQASKEVWGVNTNNFHKVTMVMNSPNHWDEKKIGNKHYFFILDGCKNDGQPRGFFNEFLKDDLIGHRKVFEVLGSKMRVEKSDNQLSGLGFSSTQRSELTVKVTGSFTRMLKIKF